MPSSAEAKASSGELKRGFGFWTGSFVVVASMVGSGILTNSGPILKSSGSYSALLILWGVGGLFALTGALTLGELGSAMPRAGGDYVFVREAFGPAVGFVYGWSMILLGFAAPTALVAYTTANYLHPLWQGWMISESIFTNGFASVLILLFTIFHCLGQHTSAGVQIATTTFYFLTLAGFAILGILAPGGEWQHIAEGASVSQVSLPSLATGFILVIYAYTGWNAAVYLAGEIREPARLLPRCLALGCLAVILLYMLVNLFYSYALSPQEIANLSEAEANRIGEVAISRLLGPSGGRAFSVMVSVGVVASLSSYILTGPRIAYAMACDRLFPRAAGRVSAKTGTPVMAILFQSAASLIFLWSGSFDQILTFASYGLGVLGLLVVSPIFILRRRPDFLPNYRVPFYPWTPIIFLVVSVAVLLGSASQDPVMALLSVGSILLGFPLYWLYQRRVQRRLN